MSNGSNGEYFLSAYLAQPGDNSVLSPRHDQGVALWRSSEHAVELVRVWAIERLSGQKHHDWPLFTAARAEVFLNYLLESERLSLNDIACLWGTPGLPRYRHVPSPAGAKDLPAHSLAHLFSGMLLDTRLFKEENIVAMAIDGGPDFVEERTYPERWYAGCISRHGSLTFQSVASPAPLYGAASALFMREPGTLMALASACRAKMKIDAEALVSSLNLYGGRLFPMTVAVPFIKSLIIEALEQLAQGALDSRFSLKENIQSAVMSAVQECCEVIAARNVRLLCSSGRIDPRDSYLSVSGGFALNCPTNSRLMDEFGFRGLLVPPCADDSGQALGLGLMGLYESGMFQARDFRFASAFHGDPLRDSEMALQEFSPWIESVSDFSSEQFVQDISSSIVAWVDGKAEVGPRALGHRSLLGDPRTAKTKDQLNRVKQRQWWRPVAPIVMSAHAAEWFELPRPSPYMLEVARVREEMRGRVPAIVHLDGSARLQTLDPSIDPRLNDALDAFWRATGIPILCNTSLNDKGEPIVDTAAEALTFCLRKGIEVIYLGGRRVGLHGHDGQEESRRELPAMPRTREGRRFFEGQEASRDVIWNGWLERGYSEQAIFVLSFMPGLRGIPGISDPERANNVAKRFARRRPAFTVLADRYRSLTGPGTSFSTYTGGSVARLFEGG
jgi:carbamoyltransferase